MRETTAAHGKTKEQQSHKLDAFRGVIQEDSPLPLYYQVQLVLEQLIDSSYFAQNANFYSEEEIAERLGVSRPTVNRAMRALVEEGYVQRQRGKRARIQVPEAVPLVFMGELLSFGAMLSRLGKSFETKLLMRREDDPPSRVAQGLRLQEGERVVHLRRLRFVEDEPVLLVDSYLSATRFGQLLQVPSSAFRTDLFTLLHDLFGVTIEKAEREVRASHVPLEDAQVLDSAPWEVCLRLQGIEFSSLGEPIEYFDSRIKGSRCVLRSTLHSHCPPPDEQCE